MPEHMAEETFAERQADESSSHSGLNQHDPVAASNPAAAADSAEDTHAPVEDKHANEDFASALENFTTETEEAVGEDRVIKGTVLKLTATHVVVDIGTKSEGMLPISEVLDFQGKPKLRPATKLK